MRKLNGYKGFWGGSAVAKIATAQTLKIHPVLAFRRGGPTLMNKTG
jgi:hypothetical protein